MVPGRGDHKGGVHDYAMVGAAGGGEGGGGALSVAACVRQGGLPGAANIESAGCQVPGLECLLVVVRAVVDHEVVPESQLINLAFVSLAMGHEALQSAVSAVAACFVVADLEAAYLHHPPQWAVELELVEASLVVLPW